jgi:hypothetical protein
VLGPVVGEDDLDDHLGGRAGRHRLLIASARRRSAAVTTAYTRYGAALLDKQW